MPFKLRSDFQPQGDQPQAIEALVRGLDEGAQDQVLLGITGSGKTFSVATVIDRTQRSSIRSSKPSFPKTPSSTSSPTTTITSRRLTCPPPTPTSRRRRRSTR